MDAMTDKTAVVKGRILAVKNTVRNKFSHAKKEYFALWVEDVDGKSEQFLLFTDTELETGKRRANMHKEDIPVKALFMDLLEEV